MTRITKKNCFEHIHEFPGDRTEDEWLTILEFLKIRIGEALSTTFDVGCYSYEDFPGYASAGMAARIRSRKGLPDIESDYMEGIILFGGNRGGNGHANVSIFPFLNSSVLTRRGRICDFGPNEELDELVWYTFKEGQFKSMGWTYEDGPGEWAGVTRPGDIYIKPLEYTLVSTETPQDSPIFIDLKIPELPLVCARFSKNSIPRISLLHVNRNREQTNLVPWNVAIPKSNSRHVQYIANCSMPSNRILRVMLNTFNIRGGWVPGKYHLSLRIQNFHNPEHWTGSSDITEPMKFRII